MVCWKADGIRGRNMELDHFLGHQRVNVCLYSETQLRSGEAFWMAIHVCPHTSRLTERGGRVIVVLWDIDHYLVVPSHPTHFLSRLYLISTTSPLSACVDLIRRLLTYVLTPSTCAARVRVDLKTLALLCINIAMQLRRTNRGIALRPPCGRNLRQKARTAAIPKPTHRLYMPPQ